MTPTHWVEKYRPSTFDDFVFQDDATRDHILKYVEQREIPHLMLSGPPGTGKTSCALLLIKLLGIDPMDTLVINASKENNVATIRDKVSQFCDVAPWNSAFRVVLLEEGDFITEEGQAVMRRLMEERYAYVRFIITCNYANKISLAVGSRMAHFAFKDLPESAVVTKVVSILDAEQVQWDIDDVTRIIQMGTGDLRKIIQTLDQYSTNGKLSLPAHIRIDGEVSDIVHAAVSTRGWEHLRSYVAANVSDANIPGLFRMVYDSLRSANYPQQTWEQAVVVVAEYLHRSSTVADQYINFAAMTVELGRLK